MGKSSYIGKSADAEAAYGSEENPANSCWDLALESQDVKPSKERGKTITGVMSTIANLPCGSWF